MNQMIETEHLRICPATREQMEDYIKAEADAEKSRRIAEAVRNSPTPQPEPDGYPGTP